MKLQAKLTLNFILLVLISIIISFLLINWNVQSQFHSFIQEKRQEWEFFGKNPNYQRNFQIQFFRENNPFNWHPQILHLNETPEEKFLRTTRNSLIWAGLIGILCAIILAYILSKFLLKRIYQLGTAMNQYKDKNISKFVPHGKEDEIDNLVKIYNLLIEKVEKQENFRKEFFIDMSHELRTPLTSIKAYLEGLVDNVFDPIKEKDIHKKTLSETNRMIHLINEMTILAKLESEETELVTKNVNLKTLTNKVLEIFSSEAKEKKLQIDVKGDVEVKVDPYKFKQVLINLIDNAITYSQEDTSIFIEMGKENNQTYWQIRNKTENLPEKDIENLFERFYRGDKSRIYNKQKPHLGIGLNIVKKIIQCHQGTISVKTENQNIIFKIKLNISNQK